MGRRRAEEEGSPWRTSCEEIRTCPSQFSVEGVAEDHFIIYYGFRGVGGHHDCCFSPVDLVEGNRCVWGGLVVVINRPMSSPELFRIH